MPIIPRRVESSFIPSYFNKILNHGREHHYQARNGSLKPGSIVRQSIEFILDLRGDPAVERHLKHHGGTLFDLILRAVKRHVSR